MSADRGNKNFIFFSVPWFDTPRLWIPNPSAVIPRLGTLGLETPGLLHDPQVGQQIGPKFPLIRKMQQKIRLAATTIRQIMNSNTLY